MRVTQIKRKKRSRKHGYRKRAKTAGGKAVLKRRRQKQRKKLTVRVRKT